MILDEVLCIPFVTISMQLVLSDLVGKSLNLQVLPCKRRMQDKQTKFKTEPKWFVLVRRTGMVWSVLDRIPGKRVVWSVLGWNWTWKHYVLPIPIQLKTHYRKRCPV